MDGQREVALDPVVNVNYEVPGDLHQEIKLIAVLEKTTVKALLIEGLRLVVESRERTGNEKTSTRRDSDGSGSAGRS